MRSSQGLVGDACEEKQAHNWQKEPPAHFAYFIRKNVVSYSPQLHPPPRPLGDNLLWN
jgi:hypothetical protein